MKERISARTKARQHDPLRHRLSMVIVDIYVESLESRTVAGSHG